MQTDRRENSGRRENISYLNTQRLWSDAYIILCKVKQNRGVTYFITLSIFNWPLHPDPVRCMSMTQPANMLSFWSLLTIAMLTLIAMLCTMQHTNILAAFDYSDANTNRYVRRSMLTFWSLFYYSDANTDRYLPVSLVRLGPLSKFRLRIVHDRYLGLIIQASRLLRYLLREYK